MKPEDLLDAETLPDDLRWLAAEFKLQPKDPVFLLVAWHWHRVQQAEDTLRAANLELQTAVDSRVGVLTAAAQDMTALSARVAEVNATLEHKPALLVAQIERDLQAPLAKVLELNQAAEKLLVSTRSVIDSARRRETLATLLLGVLFGFLSGLILIFA